MTPSDNRSPVPQDGKSDAGVVQSITNNLGVFFRHLFPGIVIVGSAYVAHGPWFCAFDYRSWAHLSIVAIIALASGNVWYAINRYGVHQLVDYLMYLAGIKGPSPVRSRFHYCDDLGKYVADSLCVSEIPERARQHVAFRAGSVLFLYTIAEIGILFSLWHEPRTFFAEHRCLVISGSLTIFLVGVWQDCITRHIDYRVVEFGRKHDPSWKSN